MGYRSRIFNLKVALYTEGRADSAVITNILKGVLDIDQSDIQYDLPELEKDETDLQNQKEGKFSNWTLVKKECENRTKMNTFFETFDDNRFAVIHIDTAERHLYKVDTPIKNNKDLVNYSAALRKEVVKEINSWLNNNHTEKIAYAIAIEEIDAWILTISALSKADTSKSNNPKKELEKNWDKIVPKQTANRLSQMRVGERYANLTTKFRKPKELKIFRLKNKSLNDFCENLEKVAPNLIRNF